MGGRWEGAGVAINGGCSHFERFLVLVCTWKGAEYAVHENMGGSHGEAAKATTASLGFTQQMHMNAGGSLPKQNNSLTSTIIDTSKGLT